MAYFTFEYEISTVFQASLAKPLPVGRDERLNPSVLCLLDHIWGIMSSLGLPCIGKMLINWRYFRGESPKGVSAWIW